MGKAHDLSRRSFLGAAAGTATAAAIGATASPAMAGGGVAEGQLQPEGQADVAAAGHGGKSVAAITYRTTPRPGWVPDDFVAPKNARQQFLTIDAIDGFKVDAVLFEPRDRKPSDTTLVLRVHGSGGNYLGFEMPGLSAAGYAVLAINTRQHDDNGETDNFFDIRKDIEAAFFTAVDMGYKKIVLNGRSLGNIQVQFYAATNWDPRIRGVILPSMFAKLPWKSRHLLTQDEQNYNQLFDESMRFLAAGRVDEILPTEMRGGGGSPSRTGPVTGQHFLSYRWEATSAADGTYWIKRIPIPILMMRGDQDTTIRDFEPNWLLAEANSEGSLVPSIKFVEIPGGSHSLNENPEAVLEAEVSWLKSLGL